MMSLIAEPLPGLWLLQPKVFHDARGFFFESFNQQRWEQLWQQRATDAQAPRFVQDNASRSVAGTCVVCIFRLPLPLRASWCGWRKVRCLMQPWTCGRTPQRLVRALS